MKILGANETGKGILIEYDAGHVSYEDNKKIISEMMEDDLTNETYKPKGVGMGKPKFDYKKTTGGFKEDMKQGPKSVGTGKAKFDYKKGANMEGKSKIVKAETKEGFGSKKDEFKRTKVDGVEKKAGTKDGHYKDYEGKVGGNKGDKSKTHAGKDYEKAETKEAARTYGMGSKEGRGLRKGITNNRNYTYGKNGDKKTYQSLSDGLY